MIGHNHIFIHLNGRMVERYFFYLALYRFSNPIQLCRLPKQTFLPIGTDGHKIVIIFCVIILLQSWTFSFWQVHIQTSLSVIGGFGRVKTLPYKYAVPKNRVIASRLRRRGNPFSPALPSLQPAINPSVTAFRRATSPKGEAFGRVKTLPYS